MTLAPGTRLGPYEVLSPLGSGGMGEVYRARDGKLGREVAIKVLPESLSADPERLARFEREARVLASLNHPNIAAIYGVEDSTAVKALVLELVEGPTLQDRIEAGAIPIDEALSIARQIAEALEAAHEQGIVHRDLKPANVKVNAQDQVKVLDFGLAKALDPAAATSSTDLSRSPTLSIGTQAGMILGTAAYMSPEQARGRAADRRADVWAFGVVLWEMLTGERLFAGETVSDTLAAVLTREPDGSRLPDRLPFAVRDLLRRCLVKDPRRRLQSIGDARIAIEEAVAGTPPAVAVAEPAGRLRALTLAAAAAAVIAALGAGWLARGLRAPRRPAEKAPGAVTQLTDFPGLEREPAISPDGKSVAYVSDVSGNDDIYLLRIGGHNAVNLTADSPASDRSPAFSPDGSQIAFRSERDGGGLFVMGATGESVRRVANFGFNPAWSPDGKEIAVAKGGFDDPFSRGAASELDAVDVATGRLRVVSSGDAVQPSWSPHGLRIAYWGVRNPSAQRDIGTAAADGSEAKSGGVDVTNDASLDWSPVWSPGGSAIYFLSGRGGTMNLWRVAVDEKSGRLRGRPEPITAPAEWVDGFSIPRDEKTVVLAAAERRSTLLEADFDPVRGALSGTPRTILRGSRLIGWLDWSPDARTIVFGMRGVREPLYVIDADGSRFRQLSGDTDRERAPRWSPDGGTIVFMSDRSGRWAEWQIHPDGSDLRKLVDYAGVTSWSPDGRTLSIAGATEGSVTLDPRAAATSLRKLPPIAPGIRFYPVAWSPDGRGLVGVAAHLTFEPGEIYSFDVGSGAYRDLKVHGSNPVWLPDGERILFSRDRDIALLDTRTGSVHDVLPRGSVPGGVWQKFALSRDGRRLTWVEPYEEGDLWMMALAR